MTNQHLNFYGQTDVGNKREKNEDSFWPIGSKNDRTPSHHPYPDSPWGQLYIVADGMGGHGAGDVASKNVVETVPDVYYNEELRKSTPPERIKYAIEEAHRRILAEARNDSDKARMGSTIAAVIVQGNRVFVAWVGDSRVYRLRNNRLEQLTTDHTVLQPEIEAGKISWDELHYHPQRSQLSNSLSARRSHIEVEVIEKSLKDGDQLLLCSDGLSSEIQDTRIEKVVKAYPPKQSVRGLIEQAKTGKTWKRNGKKVRSAGGEDNITAMVLHTPGVKLSPPLPVWPLAAAAAVLALLALILGAGLLFWPRGANQVQETPAGSVAGDSLIPTAASLTTLGEITPTPTPTLPPLPTDANPVIEPPAGEATSALTSGRAQPTATLAAYVTATPALLTPTPVITAADGGTTAVAAPPPGGDLPAAEIQLLQPEMGFVFPNGTNEIKFQWHDDNNCTLPYGYGFDLWIWREGQVPPGGVLDAVAMAKEGLISCDKSNGVYHFTVGDLSAAPSKGGPGKYFWDVFWIRTDNYQPPHPDESTAASFIIAGGGGGGEGDDDGGDGGGGSGGGDIIK